MRLKLLLLIAALLCVISPITYAAESGIPAFISTPSAGGGQTYSLSLQTLILLTSLSFLPASKALPTPEQ